MTPLPSSRGNDTANGPWGSKHILLGSVPPWQAPTPTTKPLKRSGAARSPLIRPCILHTFEGWKEQQCGLCFSRFWGIWRLWEALAGARMRCSFPPKTVQRRPVQPRPLACALHVWTSLRWASRFGSRRVGTGRGTGTLGQRDGEARRQAVHTQQAACRCR